MNTFTTILIVLIVFLLVLIFIKIYKTPSLPKCPQKRTLTPLSTTKYTGTSITTGTPINNNTPELPEGWNTSGNSSASIITPRIIGGGNWL